LRLAGLRVSQQSVFGRPGCVVYSNWEKSALPNARCVLIGDVSHIRRERGQWFYRQWRHAPLPGPDDIEFRTGDANTLVDAVVTRYQGALEPMGEWLVPLHRHPEWNPVLVREVVKNAEVVDAHRWDEIRARHQTTLQLLLSL